MKKIEMIKEKITDKEIKSFYKQMVSVQRYIKKLKEENEGITVKRIKEKIYSEIYDVHILTNNKDGTTILESGKSDLFCLNTLKYIQQNPKKLLEIYDKMSEKEKSRCKEETNNYYEYNENIENNIRQILYNIIYYTKLEYFEKKENIKSEEQRKMVKEQFDIISEHLIQKRNLEEKIKSSYILRLSKMISLLDKIGDLEVYNELNNKRLDRMGLKDILGVKYKSDKSNECKMNYVLELKNKKSLEKLNINQLAILTSFYLNRIEKTTENIEKVLFTLEKRGLLGEFFKGEDITNKLNDENIKFHISQLKFLTDISENVIDEYKKNLSSERRLWLEYSEDDIVKLLNKKDIEEYRKFSKENEKMLPANLTKDIKQIQDYISSRNNLYFYKDKFMDIMMYNLLTDSKNINWGYVPECSKFSNGRNSIENKSKNILIKADIRGFNNPIALHYDLKKIKIFIKNYNGTHALPVYKGEDDFMIEGKNNSKLYMSNFILMPIHSSRIKKLKKYSENIKETSPYYKYIKHLVWISSLKSMPKHLKKSGKVENQIVDLDSGNIQSVHETVQCEKD